jgi:hypothetical protein
MIRPVASTMVPLLLFLCAALARGSEQQQLQKAVRSTNLRRTSGSTIGTLSTAVAVGAVTKLRLINADTNLPIAGYNPLPAVSRIDLNTLPTPNLSVEALTSGNANGTVVASITWRFESIVRTENAAPWAMCLNNGADIYACRRLVVGFNSSISATPFTQGSGRGVSGTTVSIHLSLFRGNSPTKAPISVAVPTKAPTTNVPVTVAPKTSAPITAAPMATKSPTTGAPATTAPVTSAPKSLAPVTAAPVTNAPMTSAPITAAPLTKAPTTSAPITKAPVAPVPTKSPVKDIEPPKLLDLTLGEQALNVLLGPRSVVVTLKVKDNQSGIKSAVVGPVGYQQTYLVPTGVNTASGVLEFNVTLTFPPSAALEAWGTQYYIDVRIMPAIRVG